LWDLNAVQKKEGLLHENGDFKLLHSGILPQPYNSASPFISLNDPTDNLSFCKNLSAHE